jgi:hypothetical protein
MVFKIKIKLVNSNSINLITNSSFGSNPPLFHEFLLINLLDCNFIVK